MHLNGQLVEHTRAVVSPFDHGFLFGDGVYEGLRAYAHGAGVKVIGRSRHTARMQAGLDACGIDFEARALELATDALLAANRISEAFVYWQVTRGTPDLSGGPVRSRAHKRALPPTVFGYCTPLPPLRLEGATCAHKTAATASDERWLRGEIKSISLLGNVMAAQHAHRLFGADEGILLRRVGEEKLVTEGTFTNVVIVDERGRWLTPDERTVPLLRGVTRDILLDHEPRLVRADITEGMLRAAREVLLVGTTTMVTVVTELDGRKIADGAGPGAEAMLASLCRGIGEEG